MSPAFFRSGRLRALVALMGAAALWTSACSRSPSGPTEPSPAVLSSTVVPTPPPPSCASVATDQREKSVAAEAASVEIPVTADAECAWTASTAEFLKLDHADGSGEATVRVDVEANSGAERRGTMLIGGTTVTVVQAAPPPPPPPPPPAAECSFTVSTPSASLSAAGGAASIAVATGDGCEWSVAAPASFITAAPLSGTGAGMVALTAAANDTMLARTATLTIAGKSVTVRQNACSVSPNPTSLSVAASGGSATVAVTVEGTCGWTVSQPPAFIAVSPTSGTGAGTVTVTVSANNTSSPRTGSFSVGGRTVTVSQAAGTAAWPPPGPLPPIVPPPAPPGARTYLTLQADPGDPRPSGAWVAPSSGFAERVNVLQSSVTVLVTTASGTLELHVVVPPGQTLAPGTYENAQAGVLGAPSLGLQVNGRGSCPDWYNVPGRFTIHEVTFIPPRVLQRFRITFEQHCSGAAPGLVGELLYEAPVYGGPIVPPQPPPGATTYMTFRGDPGDQVASGLTRVDVAPTATFTTRLNGGVQIEAIATGADGKSWNVTLKSGRGVLAAGTYEHPQEMVNAEQDTNGLSFRVVNGTVEYGCLPYMIQGRFQINEITLNPDYTIKTFKATFERHCGGVIPGVVGEISIVR